MFQKLEKSHWAFIKEYLDNAPHADLAEIEHLLNKHPKRALNMMHERFADVLSPDDQQRVIQFVKNYMNVNMKR